MRDVGFWKALLNIEEYRWEDGLLVHNMTDESFLESCLNFEQQLLLKDELFNGYYITYWDHIDDCFIPFVIRMRYLASFAAAG